MECPRDVASWPCFIYYHPGLRLCPPSSPSKNVILFDLVDQITLSGENSRWPSLQAWCLKANSGFSIYSDKMCNRHIERAFEERGIRGKRIHLRDWEPHNAAGLALPMGPKHWQLGSPQLSHPSHVDGARVSSTRNTWRPFLTVLPAEETYLSLRDSPYRQGLSLTMWIAGIRWLSFLTVSFRWLCSVLLWSIMYPYWSLTLRRSPYFSRFSVLKQWLTLDPKDWQEQWN